VVYWVWQEVKHYRLYSKATISIRRCCRRLMLNDLIATNHPVRVVSEVIDKVDITELLHQYKPGGTSSYHPRMLLKVLVFAYINNIYSSRKIKEAVG